MSFTAHILPLLLSPFKGILLDPRLRASNEHRSSTFALDGGLDGLPLRLSNEGLLRRALHEHGRHLVCPLSAISPGRVSSFLPKRW